MDPFSAGNALLKAVAARPNLDLIIGVVLKTVRGHGHLAEHALGPVGHAAGDWAWEDDAALGRTATGELAKETHVGRP